MILASLDSLADRIPPVLLANFYERLPDRLIDQVRTGRFRRTIRWVAQYSPFYRAAFRRLGIDPRQVKTPADLGDFFTTPEDIIADPESFLCRPPAIVFESSGTSGRNKRIYYDQREMEQMGQVMAAGLPMMGIGPADRVANAFDFSMWIPGMLTHNALMAAGNFCMAFGKVDPVEVYRRLRTYRFNVVMGEPTWLIRLTELAERDGSVALKTLVGGAEEMPREAIGWMHKVWRGAIVRMCYGSVELGSGLGYQPCDFDGYHLDDIDFYHEAADVTPDGYGELVYTTLRRRVMPLIRYRSRDVTRLIPGRCACGRKGARMSRLRGRRDEIVVAGGGNLYPLMFENILAGVAGLTRDWQVVLRLQDLREVMEIHVESLRLDHEELRREILARAATQYPDLMKNLALGIFQLRVLIDAPAELRTSRKLKRLVDLRYDNDGHGSATRDGPAAALVVK